MPCILNFSDSTTAVVVISMMGRFFVTFSVNTVMQQVTDSMQRCPEGFFYRFCESRREFHAT